MRVHNHHERVFAATPERLAELVADFEAIWPAGPAPSHLGEGRYEAPPMIWEEFDRPGAIRAFRILSPDGLKQLEHWFDVEPRESGTLLRHTVEGETSAEGDALWHEKIEPPHNLVMEAIFDKIERIVE